MIVFIHTPKCGGMFVKRCISELCLPAVSPDQHKDYLESKEVYGDAYYFVAVRNPLTWYQSLWRFRMQSGWGGNWPPGFAEYADECFERWVARVTADFPGYLTELFDRYVGDCAEVFRQETLADDMVRFFGDGRIRSIQKENVGGIHCEHTDDTIDRIVESERKAFERWGYSHAV